MAGLPCCVAGNHMLEICHDEETTGQEMLSAIAAWTCSVSKSEICSCAEKLEQFPWCILETESDFATTGFLQGFDLFAGRLFHSIDGFDRRTEEQMTAWISGQDSSFDSRPMLLSCLLRKGYSPTMNLATIWATLEKRGLSNPENPGVRFPLIAAQFLGKLTASSSVESGGSWDTLNLHLLHLSAWATAISTGSGILFDVDEETWDVRHKKVTADWIYASFCQALAEFSVDFRNKTFLGESEEIADRALRILHGCWKETRQSFPSREEYRNEAKAKLWIAVHDFLAENALIRRLTEACPQTPWFNPLNFLSVCLWGGSRDNEDIIKVLESGPQLLAQRSILKTPAAIHEALSILKSLNCMTECVMSQEERALCLRHDALLGAVLYNYCKPTKLPIAGIIEELDEDRIGKNRFELNLWLDIVQVTAYPGSSS